MMKYILLLLLMLSVGCDTTANDVPGEPDGDGELICYEVQDGTLCAWTAPPTYEPTYEEDEDDGH